MKHAEEASGPADPGGPGAGRPGGAPVDVVGELAAIDARLGALAGELVPERIAGHQVGRVVRHLGRIERRAAGARLVLAQAAADTGAWKGSGARSAAEHLAKEQGISVGEAKAELEASSRLAELPLAREAAASGELSKDKTRAVAQGAAAEPGSEAALVDAARNGDLAATRDEARKAVQRADERSGRQAERIYQRRSLKTWLSVDGEGHGTWNVPTEYQARFLAALEPYRREAFRRARQAGRRDPHEALMADALDLLARDILLDTGTDPDHPPRPDGPTGPDHPPLPGDPDHPGPTPHPTPPGAPHDGEPPLFDDPGTGPATGNTETAATGTGTDTGAAAGAAGAETDDAPTRRAPATDRPNRRAPAQVHVHIDFDALRRGHAQAGETCEIDGIGPIPVSLAQAIMADSLLRLIVIGTDITKVTSHRRYIPVALRTAVLGRDRGCVVPGCGAVKGLEIDHWDTDFGLDGPTAEWNLTALCRHHHHLKTHCGWTLTGGPGHWRFDPPPPSPRPPTTDDEPP